MTDPLNESDLLGYVEDTLDPETLARLRARLDDDVDLRHTLDRLRVDRVSLRALGEPEVPMDFMAALESTLARPMLIDTPPTVAARPGDQPGVYRRRHRAKTRRWRVGPYAAAAVLVLALIAGIWITTTALTPDGPDSMRGDTVAAGPNGAADGTRFGTNEDGGTSSATNTDDFMARAADDAIDPAAHVHHWGPLAASPAANEAPTSIGRGADDEGDTSARGVITAPIVLVLSGADLEAAESRLERAVAGLFSSPDPTALVRNFSMAEARLLEARYFPASPGGPTPPAVADLAAAEADPALAERIRRQRKHFARMLDELRTRSARDQDDPPLESRLLHGAEGLASYEKQLELSARGATHTIAIPADALGAFLRELHGLDGGLDGPGAALRALENGNGSDPAAAEDWIAERRVVDAFMQTLREPGAARSILLLPIIIE